MKTVLNFLMSTGVFCSFLLIAPVANAQVIGGATGSAGLMGDTSSGSSFQGSSSQTSPGSLGDGAARANLLQRAPISNLKVDSPTISAPSTAAVKTQSAWKIFAVLAALFLIAAVVMFVLGYKQKVPADKVLITDIEPEEIITKDTIAKEAFIPAEKPEIKKPKKKKKSASKVKRRKKRK